MLAIGMTGDSCRHALAAADKHEEVYVSIGRHPHESRGLRRSRPRRSWGAGAHPKVRAIGEAGLDYKRDYSPRDDQQRAFVAQIELARTWPARS